MPYFYFFKGFSMGITIAALGGPVGILCMRRTVQQGMSAGVATGFGAALADALFGAIAGFGVTLISSCLIAHQKIIGIAGSFFMIYLGIRSFFEKDKEILIAEKKSKNFANAISSFFITLTNPTTILFFIAVSISLQIIQDYYAASAVVTGIFIGSLSWFSALAFVITQLHKKLRPETMTIINKLFSVLLILFGLFIGLKNILGYR
jgi:threonine/homoserine/homoserine lactone efflux protein